LQFTAYHYLDVFLVIAIKRGGVILSVLAGWLIFRESKIAGKLFATAIMGGGMLLIYLPASRVQDVLLTLIGLGGRLASGYGGSGAVFREQFPPDDCRLQGTRENPNECSE
jgi:hypothetical protein